jgi:multidrug efflux pump subunit AcrA (membrane-fusion protein)
VRRWLAAILVPPVRLMTPVLLVVPALLLLLVMLVLQGCSPDPAEASSTAMPARPVVLARGVVDVEGGLLSVRAKRAGQLVEIAGTLGQEVTRGTPLATLSGDSEHTDVDVARAELQRARAELASARSRQALLREQLSRVREAVALGAESGRVLDELQIQVDAQDGAVPVAAAAVAAAEAHLRASVATADSRFVRAPADGRIVQVNARGGDVVGTSDPAPLFLLRPHGGLIVRASVPARDTSRVQVGSAVSIEAADDESLRYTGRVRSLGEIARKPDPTSAADDFSSDRVVDCLIELDADASAPLRIGSVVVVRFTAPT